MTAYSVYLDDHCVNNGVGVFDWMRKELSNRNGKPPKWSKELDWDNIDDFILFPDGHLALLDTHGTYAFCPEDLFSIEMSQ